MYSARRRSALTAKIAGIADEALDLMKAFDAATEKHLTTLGISKEKIEQDAARLLRQWTSTA